MVTRAEHYGIGKYIGCGTFDSKACERDFHERFTAAFRDFRADTGLSALEDFYGERGNRTGWIWSECTGVESEI